MASKSADNNERESTEVPNVASDAVLVKSEFDSTNAQVEII